MDYDFSNKTILLGICGGVAAYKAYDLIRELYRRGAQRVLVALSDSADRFISPLTLQALSKEAVIADHLAVDEAGVPYHIAFAQQADVFLILPATANTLGKLAHGLSDDMLSTTAISWTGKPLLLAPAMNTRMWENPMVQQNMRMLRELPHVSMIEPCSGLLACGETGQGHLADADTILQALYTALHPHPSAYQGKHVVITAGGTQAAIDPVRVITNRSTGKMGIAFAQEASAMGAQVTLIVTPTVNPSLYQGLLATVIPVETVDEMGNALNRVLAEPERPADVLVMTAAVSDFEPNTMTDSKIKRNAQTSMSLELKATSDLLKHVAQTFPKLYTLGFAAESSHDLSEANAKRERKGIDALCLNDISRTDIGFGSAQNEVTLITDDGEITVEKAPKRDIARQVLVELTSRIEDKISQSVAASIR